MTVSDFWHQAFIAALGRLPADEAKIEADKAVTLAIAHWQAMMKKHGTVVPVWTPYADVNIAEIRKQSPSPDQGCGAADNE